jgi:SHS2 domain-containing protein
MPFTLVDHTADVRLKVTGTDQEELFRQALAGMTALLAGSGGVPQTALRGGKTEDVAFRISAPDMESLLIDFLNEALFVMQSRRAFVREVRFSLLQPQAAAGTFTLAPADGFEKDIKAATYHDIHIRRRRDGSLQTVIVFDI